MKFKPKIPIRRVKKCVRFSAGRSRA
jgi:hypothetical protein